MSTRFLVILTFLFFQTFGTSIINASSNVTCIQTERESLIQFKQALTDSHNLLSTWSGLECCEWHGVGCGSRNGHVVKLDLRSPVDFWLDYNCLGGELSHSLQNLKHLRYLDLSMNNFSGKIPEFLGSFNRLEYLNLSRSGFSGIVPHHLGNLSRLQYLDFRNYFVEDVDHLRIIDDFRWVSSLSSLTYLDLSGMTTGNHTDWLHPVSMPPSLLTLNLVWSDINITFIKFTNFTSLSSLDLSYNNIYSTIPAWLSNLTSLKHLNLCNNNFYGHIPDFFGSFNALASLDLSFNSFETSIPDQLCNLSSLVHLDLSMNRFTGRIPGRLRLLFRLEALYLSYNHLSGNIPMSLGQLSNLKSLDLSCNSFVGVLSETYFMNLSKLKDLDLSGNMFTGHIPSSLGLLLRLEALYLSYNHLSGNIPMSLGQLSKLKSLDLSYNSLVDVLSESHFTKLKNLLHLELSLNSLASNFSYHWIPPFQLQTFEAHSCNFGPHFPNWLQTQTNLQRLDLSNSSVSDTIPEWFDNILNHILYLDLSNNQMGGKLPRFHFVNSNKLDDIILKMNSNKFEGLLAAFPTNVYILDLSDNLLSGHVPQTDGTMVTSLEVVNLSKNRFTGSIPVHLCKIPSIEILDLSKNKFSGRLPGCLGNLIRLQVLDLTNNTITGVVPSSLGSLTNLESLHLRNNRFEGTLPLSLKNLKELVIMDVGNNFLTGSIPFWIGENLSSLKILNLQSNKFTGKIPLQLCQLNALHHLNLAQNNIIGSIPHCFVNLSGMINDQVYVQYSYDYYEENILASMKGMQLVYTKTIQFLTTLDLSSNNITGEIPDVLMNLVGLKNLNLSRNQLKGHVPRMIGNLSKLESLDLSMNMLSGRIPQSLINLNFLSYLNLSFNNLSGAIPVGNQLQTLVDRSIYDGNDGLCGPPLSRSCNDNNSSYNHVGKHEGHNDDEGLWFYFGMGPGVVVGFIGLLGSLHFIRSWRVAYFDMLENVYGWLTMSILVNLARVKRTLF